MLYDAKYVVRRNDKKEVQDSGDVTKMEFARIVICRRKILRSTQSGVLRSDGSIYYMVLDPHTITFQIGSWVND